MGKLVSLSWVEIILTTLILLPDHLCVMCSLYAHMYTCILQEVGNKIINPLLHGRIGVIYVSKLYNKTTLLRCNCIPSEKAIQYSHKHFVGCICHNYLSMYFISLLQVSEVSPPLSKSIQVEKEARVHHCFECSQTFSSITVLMQHSKEVHGKERIHVCHICNKAFKRATHLKV